MALLLLESLILLKPTNKPRITAQKASFDLITLDSMKKFTKPIGQDRHERGFAVSSTPCPLWIIWFFVETQSDIFLISFSRLSSDTYEEETFEDSEALSRKMDQHVMNVNRRFDKLEAKIDALLQQSNYGGSSQRSVPSLAADLQGRRVQPPIRTPSLQSSFSELLDETPQFVTGLGF